MSHKVAFPVRGMITPRTLIGLLPRVNHDMSTQVRRVREGFTTVSAAEGFLPFPQNRFGVDQELPARGKTSTKADLIYEAASLLASITLQQ